MSETYYKAAVKMAGNPALSIPDSEYMHLSQNFATENDAVKYALSILNSGRKTISAKVFRIETTCVQTYNKEPAGGTEE